MFSPTFFSRILSGLLGLVIPCMCQAVPETGDSRVFAHGVASGDPMPWAVVIWTRVTPVPEAIPGSGIGPPAVLHWEVARDAAFTEVVRSGDVTAIRMFDHTAAVDVWGLTPDTDYYYRFRYGVACSRTGRTRTAPSWFAHVTSVRFALVSCAHYERGFYAGYRHLAERNDLDFILHVGDYIYEYAAGGFGLGSPTGRRHDPLHETIQLGDYRRRYAQYHTDPDLQNLHARHPFIMVWDDHEVANNAWRGGAQNHTPGVEGDFARRRAQAYQAYFEWLPIRRPNPWFDPSRIYRRFVFGDLVDLSVLDLRQYRDEQVSNFDLPTLNDRNRTMAGFAQLGWLGNTMVRTRRQWRLLANSVVFAPWQILDQPPRNPFSIAGEIGTRILNPWIQDVELDSHGYTLIDVTPQRVQSETWHLSDRADPNATIHFYRGWQCPSGTSRLNPIVGPVGAR